MFHVPLPPSPAPVAVLLPAATPSLSQYKQINRQLDAHKRRAVVVLEQVARAAFEVKDQAILVSGHVRQWNDLDVAPCCG